MFQNYVLTDFEGRDYYNETGDNMKVYLDLLLIFNFLIDLLLLSSTAYLLKRKVSFYRLCMGAFLGGLSVFILFLPLSNLSLLMMKFFISVAMIVLTFHFRQISYFLKNLGYFYFASILLGGAIYLWNATFSFEGVQNSFITNSYQLNFLGLLLLSPICIAYYIRKMKGMKEQYSFYQSVFLEVNDFSIVGVGYLDSGNVLTYKKRPVILTSPKKISFSTSFFFLPYQTASGMGLLKCYPVSKVIVGKTSYKNVYVGILEEEIQMDGIDFLLPRSMIGECYD